MADQVSANQLAASGLTISLRDQVLKYIETLDETQRTKNVEGLYNQLQSQEQPKKPEKPVQQKVAKPAQKEETDDEGGLMFFDPEEEKRKLKEQEFLEKQKNRKNLLRDSDNSKIGGITAQTSL